MTFAVSNFLLKRLAGLASPAGARARLSVLRYYRVLSAPDAFNTWDVTANAFDLQVRALTEHFSPLPLVEAVERLTTGSLPARAVCVTFDDVGVATSRSDKFQLPRFTPWDRTPGRFALPLVWNIWNTTTPAVVRPTR